MRVFAFLFGLPPRSAEIRYVDARQVYLNGTEIMELCAKKKSMLGGGPAHWTGFKGRVCELFLLQLGIGHVHSGFGHLQLEEKLSCTRAQSSYYWECLEIATAALDADTGFRSSDVVDIPLPHGSQQASSSKAFPSESKPCPAGRKGLDWRRRPAGFPQGGQCWAEGVPAMLRWGVWLRLYAWVEEDASAGMSANDAHSGVVF